MVKKIIWYCLAAAVLAVLVYSLDYKKQQELKKAPELAVKAAGAEVPLEVYRFVRDGREMVQKEELELEQTEVPPRTELTVDFQEKPDEVAITEMAADTYENPSPSLKELIHKARKEAHFLPIPRTVYISSDTRDRKYLIQAKWENGREADYLFRLKAKQLVSYQNFFYQDEENRGGNYDQSLLIVSANGLPEEEMEELQTGYFLKVNTISMKEAADKYPDLNIAAEPMYILFDTEKEVFRTESLEEMKLH